MENHLKDYLGFVFFLCFSLLSCEKVIEVPLEDSQSLLVIEGNIDDSSPYQEVLLSKSTPFSFSGDRVSVSGATVSLREDNNGPLPLLEHESGQYRLAGFKGKPGSTYSLTVTVDGEEYTATSIMPFPVSLDSVGTISTTLLTETIISAAVIYQDPEEEKNYYRFKVRINDVPNSTYWVFNDRFTNGNVVSQTLADFSNKLHPKDRIRIEMQCIDSAVYAYWNGLSGQHPGASTPSNPISNISNGALGYFSAHTLSYAFYDVK